MKPVNFSTSPDDPRARDKSRVTALIYGKQDTRQFALDKSRLTSKLVGKRNTFIPRGRKIYLIAHAAGIPHRFFYPPYLIKRNYLSPRIFSDFSIFRVFESCLRGGSQLIAMCRKAWRRWEGRGKKNEERTFAIIR